MQYPTTFTAIAMLVLALTGCESNGGAADGIIAGAPDTLTFEGEYRGNDGSGRWMRCTDGRYFDVRGPGADSLFAAYATQTGHVGDAVKVWLKGGWSVDSSVVVSKTMLLAPAMRCAPIPNDTASGSYFVELPGSEVNKRGVRIDLFANGRAAQYSTVGSGAEREETGTWGMDSDGRLELTWPQRPRTFTFMLRGDSLRQMAPLPAGAEVVLLRTGPPDAGHGVFGEVCRLIMAEAGVIAPEGGAQDLLPNTSLHAVLPTDTGLQALAATITERYAMPSDVRDRRWPTIETVQDLTELVRSLKR